MVLSSAGLCGKTLQPSHTTLLASVGTVTVTDGCANDHVSVIGRKRVTWVRRVLEGPSFPVSVARV